MKFLSDRSLVIIGWAVGYASFFRIIPYRWNSKSQKLEYTTSPVNLICFQIVKYFYFLHQIFLFFSIGQSALARRLSFTLYILHCCYFILYLVVCGAQMSLTLNGRDWHRFMYHQIQFYTDIQSKNTHYHELL